METLTGTLRVGMAADLVLIDGDLEATPADQVGQRGIALTVVGGRIIHQAHGFA
jgi:predicted amidohydrolase YtcJ